MTTKELDLAREIADLKVRIDFLEQSRVAIIKASEAQLMWMEIVQNKLFSKKPWWRF